MTDFGRIDRICRHLTDADRHVTDDAALNRLITAITRSDPELLRGHLRATHTIFDSFYIALTESGDLDMNNLSFLIEAFGIYYSIFNDFENAKKFETGFLELFRTKTFESSGMVRNAWLAVLPRIYRLPSRPLGIERRRFF